MSVCREKVLFLSGKTRGATLEGIGRSFYNNLRKFDIELVELNLLDLPGLLASLKTFDLSEIRFVLSGAGAGMDLSVVLQEKAVLLWDELRIPFITLHGDSPAYFFDRHVVPSSNFVSLYAFAEHHELRRRLPKRCGPTGVLPPILLNEISSSDLDVHAKTDGTLLFLKNGKDPSQVKRLWSTCLNATVCTYLMEMAAELEDDLDSGRGDQIDDMVTQYLENLGVDSEHLVKVRLFCIAQLDDYLRAVKATRMAEILAEFPVHIRGNDWHHVNFTGKRATYIDRCDYAESIGLIRSSLGLIDMSANTASCPHDRVMRAFGARALCLTNAGQQFFRGLPYEEELTFRYEGDSLRERVAHLLANKKQAVEYGIAVAEAFRKANPPERAFEKMLHYAALVRLERLPQRPQGLQDFHVWPPKELS